MYRKILVPLDGSDFAEYALPPALSLAERSGGEIHLATAVSSRPPFLISEETEGARAGWFEEGRVHAGEYLREIQDRLGDLGTSVPVHAKVLSGSPVRGLHVRILEIGADQVVMTTHGRGRLQRLWLGSVADGLIRRVPCPILLWRPKEEVKADLEARPAFRKVLVPLDGSELAEAMIPRAERLARLFGAPLALVSVFSAAFPLGSPYIPHAAEEEAEREAQLEGLEAYLARVAEEMRKRGVEVEAEVLTGPSAAEGIIEQGERIGADLTALSTRGHGGITRMVVGSVADKVIRGSDRPVLVHLETEAMEA